MPNWVTNKITARSRCSLHSKIARSGSNAARYCGSLRRDTENDQRHQAREEVGAHKMTERPILFSAPMVRAILSGSKSQTRRVVNGAPADWAPMPPQAFYPTIIRGELEEPGDQSFGAGDEDGQNWISCKFGQPGDRLWVRETWQAFERGMDVYDGIPKQRPENCGLLYAADDVDAMNFWRPSIHMPRWASRLTLEITGVRVERLQDISEADARAEGCPHTHLFAHDPREWFTRLWGDINGADSWAANPWVWVVEFRRVEAQATP